LVFVIKGMKIDNIRQSNKKHNQYLQWNERAEKIDKINGNENLAEKTTGQRFLDKIINFS